MRALDSFVNRLQLGFGVLVAASLLVLVSILVSEQRVGSSLRRSEQALSLLDRAQEIQLRFSAARAAEREFLQEDLRTPNFFQSGDSPALERHRTALDELEHVLALLEASGTGAEIEISAVGEAVDAYRGAFAEMVSLHRERGFVYGGRIEEMRRASLEFQEQLEAVPRASRTPLLTQHAELLRDQSEYLVDLSMRARYLVSERIGILREEIDALDEGPKAELRARIDAYETHWTRLIEIDDRIGIASSTGLRGTLNGAEETLVPLTRAAVERAREGFERASRSAQATQLRVRRLSTGAALLAVGLALSLAISLRKQIRASLGAVLRAVDAYARGDRAARVGTLSRRDEFAVLGEAFDRMAETLAEKADELEEINASLELAIKRDPAELVQTVRNLVGERKPPEG